MRINSASSGSKTISRRPAADLLAFSFYPLLCPTLRPSHSIFSILLSSLFRLHPLILPAPVTVQISQYSNTIWTRGAQSSVGEQRRRPRQPPPVRRTKSQRTPLSNSFAHPITFRYYVQKFAEERDRTSKKERGDKERDGKEEDGKRRSPGDRG